MLEDEAIVLPSMLSGSVGLAAIYLCMMVTQPSCLPVVSYVQLQALTVLLGRRHNSESGGESGAFVTSLLLLCS